MNPYIERHNDYWIARDDEGYGNVLALLTSWSSRYLEVVARHNVRIIRLSEYTGWRDSDVSFLLDIPGLQGVDILSDKVTDVSPIFKLRRLKTLSLFCKAKKAGDFTELCELRSAGLGWRSVFRSVFAVDRLENATILGYPEGDLTIWKENRALRELKLSSRKLETLCGIGRFPGLTSLDISDCRTLHNIDQIGCARGLRHLSLDKCPGIVDLTPISGLPELEVLEIEDCRDIESVAPLAKCSKLQRLQIAGNTTVLDGALGILKRLPRLREVLLARRSHYTHTAEEIEHSET